MTLAATAARQGLPRGQRRNELNLLEAVQEFSLF